MYDLVIVSCCDEKLHGQHYAEDLYQSQLYAAARRWAIANGKAWSIASAKYGIVSPNKLIRRYDHTLKTKDDKFLYGSRAARWLRRWAAVHRIRSGRQRAELTIAMLAGRSYIDPIFQRPGTRGFNIAAPLEGMQIGERLQYLASEKTSPDTLQMSLF